MTNRIWIGLGAGLAGGLIASVAMTPVPMAAAKIDGSGPPQGEDATVKTASAISEGLFRHKLTDYQKQMAGPLVHFGFGAKIGALYGAMAEVYPAVTAGFGVPFGAAGLVGRARHHGSRARIVETGYAISRVPGGYRTSRSLSLWRGHRVLPASDSSTDLTTVVRTDSSARMDQADRGCDHRRDRGADDRAGVGSAAVLAAGTGRRDRYAGARLRRQPADDAVSDHAAGDWVSHSGAPADCLSALPGAARNDGNPAQRASYFCSAPDLPHVGRVFDEGERGLGRRIGADQSCQQRQ